MNYFRCSVIGGGSGGGSLIVTCDSQFAGLTISCTKGTTVYRKTCPSTSPYQVTFPGLENGTWTISATINGEIYSTTVTIKDIEANLTYGFDWKSWVTAGGLDPDDYNDLDEVLEDEVALRRLFIVHASVDLLASSTVGENVTKIINNDLCAKWINLSDYALDKLYANADIKDVMDIADKYGYGEWALMPQVPTMTSNTAPSGEAFASNTFDGNYPAWKAFSPSETYGWVCGHPPTSNAYIGYKFINPVVVKQLMFKILNPNIGKTFDNQIVLQGSNTGNTDDWTDIKTISENDIQLSSDEQFLSVENGTPYLYYRLFGGWNTSGNGTKLQFYAYEPKGNVPIMTANSAPYGTASDNSHVNNDHIAYCAFDGGYTNYWQPADSTGTVSVGYQFVNPIMPRRVKIHINQGADVIKQRISSFVIKGSNDGSTYQSLLTINTDNLSSNIIYGDISNDDYYLYLKLECVKKVSSSFNMFVLQFYGRELSVSVPTMTGNTTPYGEAFSSVPYDTTYAAWKAFNPSEAKGWITSSGSLLYIGYKFTSAVQINRIMFKMVSTNQGKTFGSDLIFQGSNDNSIWTDLKTISVNDIALTTNEQYISIPNTNEFLYYRLTGGWNYAGTGTKLQFYGPDYSEKEFETGTTKKWLYDHGVELETLEAKVYGADSIAKKESSQLSIVLPSGGQKYAGFVSPSINLNMHSLVRAKLGNIGYRSDGNALCGQVSVRDAVPSSYHPEAVTAAKIITLGQSDLPNAQIAVDVTSLNSNFYICFEDYKSGSSTTVLKVSIKELWLE